MPELAALLRAHAGSLELKRAYIGTTKVAEMRNNLCSNPNFELNTAGWAADGSTILRHVDSARTGFGGLKITPSVPAGGATFGFPTVVGQVYTVSAYFMSPVARTAQIYAGGIGGSGVINLSDNVWTRISVTFTAVATTTVMYFSSQSTTGVFHLDDVLMEEGALLGTYFDGSTPAGVGHGKGYWVGVADASASKMWGMPLT